MIAALLLLQLALAAAAPADLELAGTPDAPVLTVGGVAAGCDQVQGKPLSLRLDPALTYRTLFAALEKLRACGADEVGLVQRQAAAPGAAIPVRLAGPAPATLLLLEGKGGGLALRGGEVARIDGARLDQQMAALGKIGEPVALEAEGDTPVRTVLQIAGRISEGKKATLRMVFGLDGVSAANLAAGIAMQFYRQPASLPDPGVPALSRLRAIFGASDLLRLTEVQMPAWTAQESGFCLLEQEGKKVPVAFGVGFSTRNLEALRRSEADVKARQAISRLLRPLVQSGALKHPHLELSGENLSMTGAFLAGEKDLPRKRWSLMAIGDLPLEKLAKESCALGERTVHAPLSVGPADASGAPIGPRELDLFSQAKGGAARTAEEYLLWIYQPLTTDDAAAEKLLRAEAQNGFKNGLESIPAEAKPCFDRLSPEALAARGKLQLIKDPVAGRMAALFKLDVKQLRATLPAECAGKEAQAELAKLLQ